MEQAQAELIFIPLPGNGHLIPILEFAKRLIDHDGRISVTVLSIKGPFASLVDTFTKSVADSQPRIRLINLPSVDLPSLDFSKSIEAFIYAFIESYLPHVRKFLEEIVCSTRVVGLVLDIFCLPMAGIAQDLGIPWYMFLTSNAGFLGLMLGLPSLHSENQNVLPISDPVVSFPGWVNPIPASVLPEAVFNSYGGYVAYVKLAQRFKDAKGIILNTFQELESFSLNHFAEGENSRIYPVGPVLDLSLQAHPEQNPAQRDEILKWLDEQPRSSVVFLCFGSMGTFGAPQVKEIAIGLEKSGYRFLWSLRGPNVGENVKESLPEEFLERIGKRGKICGWAPQKEVLGHGAVGGFVSHCGWNSILESLWFGVPIATLPLYAEQQLNAFRMVKELGLAVELSLDSRMGGEIVAADTVAEAVRRVMDGGSELRKKVEEMSEKARVAVAVGGSSHRSVGRFINDILGN